MNKIVILCPSVFSSHIPIIDELIDRERFEIVRIGQISIGNFPNKNFDIIYGKDNLCEFNPHFGKERINKSSQLYVFDKYNIKYPKSYKLHSGYYLSYYTYLNDYSDENKFVIKYEHGAKGIGQVLLSKKEFELFITAIDYDNDDKCSVKSTDIKTTEDAAEVKADSILTKFNFGGDLISLENNPIDLLKNANDCFVQEFIETKNEYRLLAFYNQPPILIKRGKAENGWQCNSCQSKIGEEIDINILLSNKNFEELYLSIQNLFYAWDSPAASFDIYEDINGNFGCFEFSTEFGYVYIPKEKLFNRFNNALEYIIKSKLKDEGLV
jgi:hypothetical protein